MFPKGHHCSPKAENDEVGNKREDGSYDKDSR